jgi:hypothetical protein
VRKSEEKKSVEGRSGRENAGSLGSKKKETKKSISPKNKLVKKVHKISPSHSRNPNLKKIII